jgi:hypothetical protein
LVLTVNYPQQYPWAAMIALVDIQATPVETTVASHCRQQLTKPHRQRLDRAVFVFRAYLRLTVTVAVLVTPS